MKKTIIATIVALLAACASVVKVEGDQVVNNRMKVTVAEAWNKVSVPGGKQPFDSWTQEGLSLDHLRLWAAVKSGQSLVELASGSTPAGAKARRVPTYRSGMPMDEIVNLFEMVYSADGSVVTLDKVSPGQFAGENGVHFEFSVARKRDGVQLKGVGWASVRNNELFAASFVAPRLAFYPRLLPKAQSVVTTARIL